MRDSKSSSVTAKAEVSTYLDTRRAKKDGKFPLKIRIYDPLTKKTRLYKTSHSFTPGEYQRISHKAENIRLNKFEREIKGAIEALQQLYKVKAESLPIFTFDSLEASLLITKGDNLNLFFHFEQEIQSLKQERRISTASSHSLTVKSLKTFMESEGRKNVSKLLFQEVDKDFLSRYEDWMIRVKEKSSTTVGIYTRNIRTIFNKAIHEKTIPGDIYPFGQKKYIIPSSKKVNKALNKEELTTLFKAIPQNPEQEKAKDFWFFSYACNGMNMKDILYLKWKNVEENQIKFVREKTKRTNKSNQKFVQVPLTALAKKIIEKYGSTDRTKTNYVFDVLSDNMNEEEKHSKKQNFTRLVNQHLKALAKANGLTEEVSTYWARHSFATAALRNKAGIEFVSEALGHSDTKTTLNYFAGFEGEDKKAIMESLQDFT
ncbi:site-specific integrase [Litoribacter ruber]|uniref:tyrosine-type recombinase/integrase n=1 Tax=Litoribacter ruber TaxID=702568 RepID=UPI001BD93C64|nr:site-specific integrase [Litoribacter ruber]MBT0811059.1 site-specific integrase [Litoribacter ruber]